MDILALVFASALAQQTPCEALKALALPAATITATEFVVAGPQQTGRGQSLQLPAHCRVSITLAPSSDSRIAMELWLPAESWNGNFLAVGNGGWAGNIERGAMAAGLSRGYAAASNDTGHTGGSASFALGHPEKVVDFGYRAMHEMAVQSKVVIQAYYKRAPRLSYYQGCSTGGRQGLMEAQRYPDDFDAIVAGAPVYNQIHLERVAGRATGGHAARSVAPGTGEQDHAARQRGARRLRRAGWRQGRNRQPAARLPVRPLSAGVQSRRRPGLPDPGTGRFSEERLRTGDDEGGRPRLSRATPPVSRTAGAFPLQAQRSTRSSPTCRASSAVRMRIGT